jgi:hypothetical protein
VTTPGFYRASSAFGGVAVWVFGGLIPGLGIAYFALQMFCIEMRLIESFACGVWQCLRGTHDKSEPTTAPWSSKRTEGGILVPS